MKASAVIELPPELAAEMEARVLALVLAEVEARLAKVPAPTPERIYMRCEQFAERHAISKRTVSKLLREGLPHFGAGKLLRIDVAAADAWLRARGSSR